MGTIKGLTDQELTAKFSKACGAVEVYLENKRRPLLSSKFARTISAAGTELYTRGLMDGQDLADHMDAAINCCMDIRERNIVFSSPLDNARMEKTLAEATALSLKVVN